MDLLIVPERSKKLSIVTLPKPKDNSPQNFLYDEDNLALHEITQYKDDFRSWFVDNQLISEGCFNLVTKIDPLFVFLPQLIRFAKSQFRSIGDICQEFEQHVKSATSSVSLGDFIKFDRLDYALSPDIKWENICDTKEIDDELYVRFSEAKTIEWLVKKHMNAMKSLRVELGNNASKATVISYALDLVAEYVPESLVPKFREAAREKQFDLR